MSLKRSLRDFRIPAGCLILLAVFAAAVGCSTANNTDGQASNHLTPSGKSVAGWVIPAGGSLHAKSATQEYISKGSLDSCTGCHGGDLSGGISKVSCFDPASTSGCHHGTIPGWGDPQGHGATAKKAPGNSSFFSCQVCHGKDFSGGGAGVACGDCHGIPAPHPFPWRVATGSAYDHDTTNTANAPVCYQCHDYRVPKNPNNPHQPPVPALPGTSPGCFNGTMCHNEAGHPAGWVASVGAAQPHGVAAKKDGTVAGQGFPSCQECHGNNYAGTAVGPSCINNASCHGAGVASPHAPRPWRDSPYTHDNTFEAGNAPVCYVCHKNRQNFVGTVPNPSYPGDSVPAGCFNNTLCHGAEGHRDDPGWISPLPGNHGKVAKNDLSACQTCHATPGFGGTNPRFNVAIGTLQAGCEDCHKPFTAHAPATLPGYSLHWDNHATSGSMNAVCILCHGANLQGPAEGGVGPRCEDCHRLGPPLTSPTCTTCHQKPPSGTPNQFPNFAGTHNIHNSFTGVTQVCDTCHSGAGFGSGANHFMDNVVNVVFLAKYNEKNVTGTYTPAAGGSNDNGGTCTNVNCHGGQPTPNWRELNAIVVETQCTSCHRFTSGLPRTRYNDYTNTVMDHTGGEGQHALQACTFCHDTTKLAALHFVKLDNTAAWMQAGGQTIQDSLEYPGDGGSCNNTPGGCH